MDLPKLLMLGVAGWTALGLVGVTLSLVRGRHGVPGEQERLRRGLIWIVGVWVVYLGALLTVSLAQPQRVVAMGQEQCYDKICFAVTGAQVVPSFPIRDEDRLVRVSIRVRNKGHNTQNEALIRAYLIDGQGRRWQESTGVSGVRLTASVPGVWAEAERTAICNTMRSKYIWVKRVLRMRGLLRKVVQLLLRELAHR
jgi:hypothetical protein